MRRTTQSSWRWSLYSECDGVAKIYKKVTYGVRPQALRSVRDSEFRALIEQCLAESKAQPSASLLLQDPFFDGIHGNDNNEYDDDEGNNS